MGKQLDAAHLGQIADPAEQFTPRYVAVEDSQRPLSLLDPVI
jgi:hypothetical protein